MLQTVGEGAERLLCTPHAQPWPAACTHRKVRSTITLGDARNLAKRGKIFRVISERDISLLLTKKLSYCARSFQSAGVSYWLRDISLLRRALVS